jgi:hypothetical protein
MVWAAGVWCVAAVAVASPGKGWEDEVSAWRAERVRRLTSETGWLTLVGLHWFSPGKNRVGSAPDNDVVIVDGGPARVGVFTWAGEAVTVEVAPGVALRRGGKPFGGGVVEPDEEPLEVGTLSLVVIRRGPKTGLRVKDSEAPTRKAFAGVPAYPVTAAWRKEARWVPHHPPKQVPVANVLGMVEPTPCPGAAVFDAGGTEVRLDGFMAPGDDEVSFIFADGTNRDETYGAGRFLEAPAPSHGKVILDFNKAYNPPCAFTPYAICPLPPPQNRLKVRVEAGEKRVSAH